MTQGIRPKVTWQIEETHPELVENIKEKLREVVDPEIGLNIIELGLVRDVKVQEQSAEVVMILTTPFCPYGPAMLEVTRQKAEEVLERPTAIDMGMEMWDFSMMEEGAGADWGIF
ncbi:MAG: iron-sulfur cluster assembly protein [Anaerolineales bacterium]|jgi:metal-sulfur cluster biosynthetic enzyme|nr:iron-sulfur cluster assembly protein [Anaerolineales bacterium]